MSATSMNICPAADDVFISLKGASAVTFACYNASGDSFTIREAREGGSGSQLLTCVTRYYKGSGVGGSWTEVNQAASSGFTLSGATDNDAALVTVMATALSDGYSMIKCVSTGAGTVCAVVHDQTVQRKVSNYSALTG